MFSLYELISIKAATMTIALQVAINSV